MNVIIIPTLGEFQLQVQFLCLLYFEAEKFALQSLEFVQSG